MQTEMRQTYLAHPDFQFDEQPLKPDGDALAAFAAAFEQLRSSPHRLSRRSFAAQRSAATSAFERVFADLKAQVTDHYERRFLEELQSECGRLIGTEITTYRRRGKRGTAANRPLPSSTDPATLAEDRYCLGRLPAATVERVLDIAAADIAEFRRRAREGQVSREDLSRNRGTDIQKIMHVLNRDFRRLGVNKALGAYMGTPMWVTGVAVELSTSRAQWWKNEFEGVSRAPRTEYAHIDEGIGRPKAIVYLTEVGRDDGPTSCYPGVYEGLKLNPLQEIIGRVISNVGASADSPLHDLYQRSYHQALSSDLIRRHFMLLPPELRFNSHMGWDVLPDSRLEESLTRAERVVSGDRGTFIAFDGGRLLHRGAMVRTGERISLQVVFSAFYVPRTVPRLVKRLQAGLR